MPKNVYAKNATVGKLTLSDGTGVPVTLVLPYDNGDTSISGLSRVLNEVVTVERRGKLVDIASGKRTFPTVSFSCKLLGSTGTALDFINHMADYAANVSTMGSTHRVHTVDMELHIEGTTFGDVADEVITLSDVYLTADIGENDEQNTISFSGTVYGDVTINGVAFAEIA